MTAPTLLLPRGKKPAQPARPQLKAARFLDTAQLPDPPATVDNLSRVPSWPMYGNGDWGCCVLAEIGHQEQQISLYGQGAEVRVTDADVLGGYAAVTGFDINAGPPGNNPTDNGTYLQDAMSWWRTAGMAGHRIVAYASIDPGNTRLIRQCIHLFGAVSIGFNFPASAMDQFNAGRPWDVVAGSPLEGGHCVMAGAYGADWWDTITWARRQRMTARFWTKYTDEVWLILDDEMADRLTGLTGFSGAVDLYTLGQDFSALTGQPSPIPAPPAPQPTPAPAAGETVTPADLAYWTPERQKWAANTRTLCGRGARAANRVWAKAKGLPL